MSGQLDCYRVAPGGRSPEQVACALAEKAFRQGYRVHLQVPDAAAAEALDELLWTFRADSFVPHCLLSSAADASAPDTAPVTVGASTPPPPSERSLLLLVGAVSGAGGELFQRVATVMAEDDAAALDAVQQLADAARERGVEVREHRLSGGR